MHSVSYLGHTFSASVMAPDPKKTQVIKQWPTPGNAKAVRQLLGLASYYRRYIKNFADIAAPLHQIIEKSAQFLWNQECKEAFLTLKQQLLQSPILIFPNFSPTARPFVLQTEASARGIGAVLEQGGQVVAYASLDKSREILQCYPTRMPGYSLCPETVQALSFGTSVHLTN